MSDGLDDVVAAHTVLSEVDGAAGRLVIRGHSLAELAGRTSFEEMAALMLDGLLPGLPQGPDLTAALGQARADLFGIVERTALSDDLGPVEAIRAWTAQIADGEDGETALKLLAAPAVFTAAAVRRQRGLPAIVPDPSLSQSADTLRMLRGEVPTTAQAAALDSYLVTVADHGLNASTFAARVVASTRAGLVSAVLAGISALKGPLHGGAPGPVIEMLDAIGEPANARPWLEAALERGERLMGFGHRIYRVRDPRADALKQAITRLGADAGRLRHAEAVEQAALAILRERKPGRSLETNVEFYTALLLEALGFPPEAFTCVFALGRTTGWLAHAREQIETGRLIRPQSVYVGPQPRRAA
ncbi:MAG: citrate synthase/methylcitrate synthase [Bosea sp.]|uniref:citrate synthase/methylcitrate synthase n=1 Tax=Bosea sp. (in: a-proteobacteria) TaxID=1871050 RepID=UPI001ACCB8F2|nr:citrate synthase/methylcitrate synthase [Bosea sp. (in: a-proteobacteria)]MBN9467439.1 citrate synthase/methylcitrate synthase [Bosea sp. (in: a-proteobacteria)]